MTARQTGMAEAGSDVVRLFLCGDVMLGRGMDQIQRHSVHPAIHEDFVKDARDYVRLATRKNGPLPDDRPVNYVWGDAIGVLERLRPDARIINLETSVTARGEPWRDKGIHYRMHPANVDVLTSARVDCCALANNHVLDWGYEGLADTLGSLRAAGVRTAGAGATAVEARRPAVVELPGGGRVLVFSVGAASSGVPASWAATDARPGVFFVDSFGQALRDLQALIGAERRARDVVVVSIHWGSNWGWDVERGARDFAHELIDRARVDVVHGHSSHHIRAVEVYKGRLIAFGCGDLLSDYEGIDGAHGAFRDDLSLMYFVDVGRHDGRLRRVCFVPMRLCRMSLCAATGADELWIFDNMRLQCRRFGCDIARDPGGYYTLSFNQ